MSTHPFQRGYGDIYDEPPRPPRAWRGRRRMTAGDWLSAAVGLAVVYGLAFAALLVAGGPS